ncbi:DUF2163 domain-containing protein [Azospirillaceae bacterium]
MTGRLTGLPQAETYKTVVRPILIAQFDFETETSRLWSGIGSLIWNGATWLGVGTLGTVSSIEETVDIRAAGASFQLSGVPSDLLNQVMAENLQSRQVKLWLGFLDEAWIIIADPVLLFKGYMDTVEIQDGAATAQITLNAENRLRDLERVRERNYTESDQKSEYPGDLGFDFVPAMQHVSLPWGS